MGATPMFLVACAVSGLSLSANIFSMSVANLPQQHIVAFANRSLYDHFGYQLPGNKLAMLWGIANGMPLVLSVLSSLSTNICAERLGRKITLFVVQNVIGLVSSLCCAGSLSANSFELYFVGKLLFGISIGIAMNGFTLYNVEISPDHLRGLAGSFTGLTGVMLINVATLLSMPDILGTDDRWPYLYIVAGCMHCLALSIGLFLPETPRYTYLHKGDEFSARNALLMLHGPKCNTDLIFREYSEECQQPTVDDNIDITTAVPVLDGNKLLSTDPSTIPDFKGNDQTSLRHILSTRHLRMGFGVGVAAVCARAFCGIDNFCLYSAKLFSDAFKLPVEDIQYFILATALIQILPVLITPCIIDRFPRRALFLTLLAISLFLNVIIMISLLLYESYQADWLSYIACASLLTFCFIYLFGITPIGFTIIAEVTPQAIRAKCTSISIAIFYVALSIQLVMFPWMDEIIGAYTLLFLSILPSIVTLVVLLKWMPETNGVTIAEIVKRWMVESDVTKVPELKALTSVDTAITLVS